ncbi:hypothetical protein SRABI111_05330 [Pseudomonas carnis]|nr:hypothetical protein SRABI08_05113 [Pseudomonas carnis]CAH0318731.1 hypothetical protein SRABI111_05330 [Pseudomonas carnis]
MQGLGVALGVDPGAGEVTVAVFLPHAKQHQLRAAVQMQGEPVPAGLAGGKGLAAPFAVEPGWAADLVGVAVEVDAAAGGEKRLAVVVRRLALVGFAAVAMVALQHQRAAGSQVQVVGKLRATGLELHVSQGAGGAGAGGEVPVVDPGVERLCLSPRLADATPGQAFGGVVAGGGGDGGVAEPHG